MKQIAIGTCIPGQKALEYLPHMVDKGFERFEICFHMEFYGVEIRDLAPRVLDLIAPTGQKITALGLYCNPPILTNNRQMHASAPVQRNL